MPGVTADYGSHLRDWGWGAHRSTLARFVAPGDKDDVPIWHTILVVIASSVTGRNTGNRTRA